MTNLTHTLRLACFALSAFFVLGLGAQTNQWTWMAGDTGLLQKSDYPKLRTPGARRNASYTRVGSKFWLFGGQTNGSSEPLLNDLMWFDPSTEHWVWMSGPDTSNGYAIYGTMGQINASNQPGARRNALLLSDSIGNLWLFGGEGYISAGSTGLLNDLWKYDVSVNQWTWVKGSNNLNQNGTYGTLGTGSTSTEPGGRKDCTGWVDELGNLWIFGGYGPGSSGTSQACLNDLWMYNISSNQWTWKKGGNGLSQNGTYGTLGTAASANKPGARHGAVSWTDSTGAIWLFGGYGRASTGSSDNYLNDLWSYDTSSNNWTWVKGSNGVNQSGTYGTMGTTTSTNMPGSRRGATGVVDSTGVLWLFGGEGYGNSTSSSGNLSDLWKYTPGSNNWTWVSGTNGIDNDGNYIYQGQASNGSRPGSRSEHAAWIGSGGIFWLFGGYGMTASTNNIRNDFWKFNINTSQWTWFRGTSGTFQSIVRGTFRHLYGRPGSRIWATSWTGIDGKLWLFGGTGYASTTGYSGELNDLWYFNPETNNWYFVKGSTIHNTNGQYGTLGVESETNLPMTREGAVSWKDSIGNLWLFGGRDGDLGTFGDLWRFNITSNNWTWMKGSSGAGTNGHAGTLGVEHSSNSPRSRYSATTWVDNNGYFWMFGGDRYFFANGPGLYNDLWRYNPASNMWARMNNGGHGDYGIYGTKGVPSSSNIPGARTTEMRWVDDDGNFWLFGGRGFASSGYNNPLNDLWMYSPNSNEWTWVGGSNLSQDTGSYGNQGVPNACNYPIARMRSTGTWSDTNGNLWLFGGSYSDSINVRSLNDLWRYNINSKQWIWLKGSDSLETQEVYGSIGVPEPENTPNGRWLFISWNGGNGKVWIFGGFGSNSLNGGNERKNDLWQYDFDTCLTPEPPTNNSTASSLAVCDGDSTTLSVNGVGSVRWYTNQHDCVPFDSGSTITTSVLFETTVFYVESVTCAASVRLPITVHVLPEIVINSDPTDAKLCLGDSITLEAFGGSSFFWSDSITNGVAFSPVGSDTFSVTVTTTSGCVDSASIGVEVVELISTTTSSSVSCYGGNDGSAFVSVLGGEGSYTYVWNSSSTNDTASGLTAGTYFVTILDTNGCSVEDSIQIDQPSTSVVVSVSGVTSILCMGMSTGSAAASASGGTGNKTYLWSNGSTSAGLSNLSAGTYTVTATDANGCTATTSVTLSQPSTAVNVSISSQSNVLCFGEDNGTATAIGTGGTGSIGFAWSTGSTSAAISTLTAGMYTVTATDQNNCTATISTTITEPDILTLTSTVTHPVCDNDSNGSITTTTTGGTTPYAFEWSNTGTSSSVSGLAEGSYSVTITDNNGCEASDSVTLVALSQLVATIDSSSNVLCNGDTTGMISVFASNGVEPYTYQWTNGGSTALVNANAGTHTVTVTDNLGCLDTASSSVSEPDSLTGTTLATAVTCFGDSNGSVSSTVLGGTTPYTYQWDDSLQQTTTLAMNLAPGQYSVTVTDANGCTTVSIDSVAHGNPIPVPNLGTDTTNTSGLSIVLDPGSFATYIWPDSSSDSTFVATITGTYWVQVYDQEGCMGTDTINVTIWPTGISETGMGNIVVFPNPTQGEIQIRSDTPIDKNTRIELLNLHGQLVYTEVLSRDTTSHRLHHYGLSQGTYLLRIANGSHVRVFNVVVL